MISPKNISSPLKRLIYTNSLAIPFIFFNICNFRFKTLRRRRFSFLLDSSCNFFFGCLRIYLFSLLNRKIINLKELLLYAFPISIVFLFILSGNYRDLAYQSIILFVLFVIPAAYIGIELGRERKFNEYKIYFI